MTDPLQCLDYTVTSPRSFKSSAMKAVMTRSRSVHLVYSHTAVGRVAASPAHDRLRVEASGELTVWSRWVARSVGQVGVRSAVVSVKNQKPCYDSRRRGKVSPAECDRLVRGRLDDDAEVELMPHRVYEVGGRSVVTPEVSMRLAKPRREAVLFRS